MGLYLRPHFDFLFLLLDLHMITLGIRLRQFSTKVSKMVRILNVAEKNDAAKSLADIMSNGRFRRVCNTQYV